jgi:predicted MPP superfamily phosphohydrolase
MTPSAVTDPARDDELLKLENRLGRAHAIQRLGLENDNEAKSLGRGFSFFDDESLIYSHRLVSSVLKLAGVYWLGRANAAKLRLRENHLISPRLPKAFDGLTILHLSDLHTDMSQKAMSRLSEMLPSLTYDFCVLTGDYRGRTYGPFEASLDGMARIREALKGPVYGVLGNHDTIRMVPALEAMGIVMLLNESVAIERNHQKIHLAGIDDAHHYRTDNIEKAASAIPQDSYSILLSHTPEIFRQAAHAGFDLLLGGHTHGGQICLPGGIPLTLDADLPRSLGAGPWVYRTMAGYTSVGTGSSVVFARFNCPPEITLHHFHCASLGRASIRPVADRESE